jgi:3-isopropylmalate/(R)-2-methylmalate dehydratase small subunit
MKKNKEAAVVAGRVLKLGDHIDTDLIYPGKYLTILDPSEWPRHALEGIDPNFPARIHRGDIIVAGENFGCGSSRSQAVSCLRYAGIGAIVAASFGRIFFRNSINQGLPVIECPTASQSLAEGEPILIHLLEGFVERQNRRFRFEPLPGLLMDIIVSGGLVPYTKEFLLRKEGGEV